MGTRTTDCRKFTPNIFNKSKCSHCFRQREEHSAAALESNRASRKVSKCGYLFVAPDWDFNNPLYRTKRWQRRWFVLYDDGELTYSVDEHPETVPQASIDMTRVLEVTTAEDVTGHTNSVAITAPERVTFVKGTCPEESKWWLNILAAFPKSKGRHKRNATFPGGQMKSSSIGSQTGSVNNRNRHNSYHKDIIITSATTSTSAIEYPATAWDHQVNEDDIENGVNSSESGTPIGGQDENNKNLGNEITNRVYTDQPVSSKSPPTRDKIHPETKAQARIRNRNRTTQDDTESDSTRILIEDVRRGEKLKDIANTITNINQNQHRCRTTTTPLIPQTQPTVQSQKPTKTLSTINQTQQQQDLIDEKPTRDETDFTVSKTSQIVNMRPKSLPLSSSSAPAIVSAIVKKLPSTSQQNCIQTTNKSSSTLKSSLRLNQLKQTLQNLKGQPALSETKSQNERGDPDGGCNLDDISSNYLAKNSELRVNLPAEEILNSREGWLMKQDTRTGDWTKHWFTLRGAALFFYRDPVSEERGVLDGVLDVNSLTNINEVATIRNFGFQLVTWDNRRIVLASISANSRYNWINVLRNAAGLKPIKSTIVIQEPKSIDEIDTKLTISKNSSISCNKKSEIEKDFIKAQRNQDVLLNKISITIDSVTSTEKTSTTPTIATTPITPLTPRTIHFSSDEEYRTASEGGRRESIDWGSPLSPSPPIPLALFRAKERMRIRPGTSPSPRLNKRSRSSPPSSRRSTVDSIGSDELPIIQSSVEEEKINYEKEFEQRLNVIEKERNLLRDEVKDRDTKMAEIITTLEQTELELTKRSKEMETARDKLSIELNEANCNAEKVIHTLTLELNENQKKIADLEDRLSRGIEENDTLYKRIRELEGGTLNSLSNLNKSKMKRVDSLSDLTNLNEIDPYCLDRDQLADEYNELKSRFEKAVNEIKAMKKELKESQNQVDMLEISYAALKQDLDHRGIEDRSQLQMMAERIQDLTLKYSGSEKQVRTLKQKLAKSERRRSSLKGKEQLSLSKELEIKVTELETKIDDLGKSSSDKLINTAPIITTPTSDVERTSNKKSARRRSLESSASADSLQFMVRLNQLEKRIDNASTSSVPEVLNSRASSTPKFSEHIIDRLCSLENVLISSKDKLEQSLQQLQSLRSSRTRRSVSPITDRKDSFRFVERCLSDVVKLIRESCDSCVINSNEIQIKSAMLIPDSNPIKFSLQQIEEQLRNKLGDLLKQRRVLRERNELTPRKHMDLLAERIAFESVCFGKLRESMQRAENPELFNENLTKSECTETTHLMSMLKAKLSGKCGFKPQGSVDVLACVLARRLVLSSWHNKDNIVVKTMPPVNSTILDDLLRQQNEINLIAQRYRSNVTEQLSSALAAETLSYLSANDAIQGTVQEAWRHAQETVNTELIQSEISQIMLRNAERFENTINPSFGYTLTTEERITFENFTDAVHDVLRKEMNKAIEQLTRSYEDSLSNMKKGQWRLHLDEQRKASESRQLLSEFADIIAHKSLIDARISVLKGDYQMNPLSLETTKIEFNSKELQKYENLYDELSSDLKITNSADILAEADFNFMYKNNLIKFISENKEQMKEISTSLNELEESIVMLHCNLNPNTTMSITTCNFDTLKELCHKCQELKQRIDSMMNCARKLTQPCEQCPKIQTNLCNLTSKHETELKQMKFKYDQNLNVLNEQIDKHLETINNLKIEHTKLLNEFNVQKNLIKNHEFELIGIMQKLKLKESECDYKENENRSFSEQLEDQGNKIRVMLNEREKLHIKCSQQDEEYAALLQERDYVQTELNKERERSRKLEKRLEMLELEHSKQLECLQEAYRDQILSHCSAEISGIPEEESFRQRYQTEIEQLRTLCEKGLVAMESSHRRIIADLEDRHKSEIERLLFEKEQALAEETQATLAALDAMRKAHQSEVQREVTRFKAEFLRQVQRGDSSMGSVREKEEELEELREEILSFSEKYSIKCVENAALEEKLKMANQKLKQYQQMQQLELRNKQFLAHLASENLQDTNFIQGLSAKDEQRFPDSEHGCNEINKLKKFPHCTTTLSLYRLKHKNDIDYIKSPPPLPISSPPKSENECDEIDIINQNSNLINKNQLFQINASNYSSNSISLSEINNSNSDGERYCKKFKSNKKGIKRTKDYFNKNSKLRITKLPISLKQQQRLYYKKYENSTTLMKNIKRKNIKKSSNNKLQKNIEQHKNEQIALPKISFNSNNYINNSNLNKLNTNFINLNSSFNNNRLLKNNEIIEKNNKIIYKNNSTLKKLSISNLNNLLLLNETNKIDNKNQNLTLNSSNCSGIENLNDKLKLKTYNQNNLRYLNKTTNNDDENLIELKCSTSPLSGRDLELTNSINDDKKSTSQLRRFELEI